MMQRGIWTAEEHDRFLVALKRFPDGPWRAITQYVGTRTIRQVQTHAQKYHEKIARRVRGLRKEPTRRAAVEHRIEQELLESCRTSSGDGAVVPRLWVRRKRAPRTRKTESIVKTVDVEPMHLDELEQELRAPATVARGDREKEDFDSELDRHLPSLDESLDFLIDCLWE